MATMIVKHKVADYAKWKTVFDAHQKDRLEGGISGHSVCRMADDPHTVVIIGRVKDLSKARAFAKSDTLKNAMMKAGVQGAPEIWFLNDEEDKRY